MTQLVRNHIIATKINKSNSCHLFHHNCATLMLKNKTNIHFIQQLLNHTKLNTTQIYTQISIHQLKQIHTLTHPTKIPPPPIFTK